MENALAKRHNDLKLKSTPGRLFVINAKDDIPENCNMSDICEAKNRKQSETGGRASSLEIKVNARVMIGTSIDTGDRLIIGQVGTITHAEAKTSKVTNIYLALDVTFAGQTKINESDAIA